jgi:DNA-directed RNA polymerase specialized sigma24 family protein
VRNRDPFADLEPLVQRIYAYVAYRLGEGPDAETITRTTFTRALRHRAAFDPRTQEQVPWLIAIARAVLAERHLQKADFRPSASLPRDPATHGLVGMLDEDARDLIALHYGAELTVVQMSEILASDPTSIQIALNSTLGALRGHSTSRM